MKKYVLISLGLGVISYLGLYFYFYSIQDDRFRSIPLPEDHSFQFREQFEEVNIKSTDGGLLNALLFKTDSSKGVICFWKGNGGNLQQWGFIAPLFLKHNYDMIITDYRAHGKSNGNITLENFYADGQAVYDFLKERYPENRIILAGYSLGTSIASHLATNNAPLKTILIEPKEKFHDKYLATLFYPLPKVNRFAFRIDLDIQRTISPIIIITGTRSDLYKDAIQLKSLLDGDDEFFEIKDADHRTVLGTNELDSIMRAMLSGNR